MDIGQWLQNAGQSLSKWGSYGIMFVGVILIIVAAVKIAMGFISHGKGQTNWLICIGMLLVGGFFVGSGYSGLKKLADVGAATIGNMGNGGGGADAGAEGGGGE